MKTHLVLFAFLFLLLQTNSSGQIFINKDKNFIEKLILIDKNNPIKIKQFFDSSTLVNKDDFYNLGFKWKLLERKYDGKKVNIVAKFFYFNDTLVSYNLSPILYYEATKSKRYSIWLSQLFGSSKNSFRDFTYNKQVIMKPLEDLKLPYDELTKEQLELMSPTTEMDYGFSGSDGIEIDSKEKFDKIIPLLKPTEIEAMFYAINPIVRLNAIDYYLKKLDDNEIPCEKFKLFTKIFSEFKTVRARIGCLEDEYETVIFFQKYIFQRFVMPNENCN